MIQCPVGNRCKKCVAKTESHVLKVTPLIGIRTFIATALLAYAFSHVVSFIGGGFISWMIAYFVGAAAGNLIHRISSFKLGGLILSIVVAGIICGTAANTKIIQPFISNEASMQSQLDMQLAMKEFEDEDITASMKKLSPEQLKQLQERQREAMLQVSRTRVMWSMIDIVIFALGILTPFTGLSIPFLSGGCRGNKRTLPLHECKGRVINGLSKNFKF
jgi:uncharacterized membrane protein (DUF106 family)